MNGTMSKARNDIQSVQVDAVKPVEVAPGVIRRHLPGAGPSDGWLYDLVPGIEWPESDLHPGLARTYYILFGEITFNDRHLGPGAYLVLTPGDPFRPRTTTGARLLGITLPG
ncbi:anti-sigma factor [Glycomyces mayteni]|uniref:Anti-sigma factor n=1 Tax=Glycomyces mayteni TaxID=543887 RepID=A0ABW2DDU4_9ACTN